MASGTSPRFPPPPPPASRSSSLPALRRRRAACHSLACRRSAVACSLAFVAATALLALLLLAAAPFAAARPPIPPARKQSSAPERIENVGGVLAKIGPEYKSEVHTTGDAYSATLDGKKYDAVYKTLKPGKKWGDHEVAATRAGHPKRSAKRVSPTTSPSAAKDPAARRKFQAAGDKSSANAAKPKLSENIYKQAKLHEKSVGYVHADIHPGNIRITEKEQVPGKPVESSSSSVECVGAGVGASQIPGTIDKDMLKLGDKLSKYYIREACEKHGFAFRSAAAAGQHVFRRAPPATATCGRKGSGNAGKTAATKPAVGTSGTTTQAKTAGMTSPAAARKPAAATAARPKKAEGTRGGVTAAGSGGKKPGKQSARS
ncbi:hypothetical protein DFJ73DRAFT_767685 [Zopfochytrium polystomum]|nr:hypothetical protein DFJ73DRAFT_767685 [Zopfochytrium polystomum]